MNDLTIHQVLRETCCKHAGRSALGFREKKEYRYLTYGELWEKVRRFRAALHTLGLKRGDRLAILSENRPDTQDCVQPDLAHQGEDRRDWSLCDRIRAR